MDKPLPNRGLHGHRRAATSATVRSPAGRRLISWRSGADVRSRPPSRKPSNEASSSSADSRHRLCRPGTPRQRAGHPVAGRHRQGFERRRAGIACHGAQLWRRSARRCRCGARWRAHDHERPAGLLGSPPGRVGAIHEGRGHRRGWTGAQRRRGWPCIPRLFVRVRRCRCRWAARVRRQGRPCSQSRGGDVGRVALGPAGQRGSRAHPHRWRPRSWHGYGLEVSVRLVPHRPCDERGPRPRQRRCDLAVGSAQPPAGPVAARPRQPALHVARFNRARSRAQSHCGRLFQCLVGPGFDRHHANQSSLWCVQCEQWRRRVGSVRRRAASPRSQRSRRRARPGHRLGHGALHQWLHHAATG